MSPWREGATHEEGGEAYEERIEEEGAAHTQQIEGEQELPI